MGTVHAQLVGTACMRPEGEEVGRGKDTIFRDGPFAMLEVDHLSRTVQRIAEQGQVNDAVFLGWYTLHHGKVLLFDGVIRKLFL